MHLVDRCYNTLKEVGIPSAMNNSHMLSIIERKMCASKSSAKQFNKSPQFEIVGGRVDDERKDWHKCWVCSDSSQWPDECQKLAPMNYDERVKAAN